MIAVFTNSSVARLDEPVAKKFDKLCSYDGITTV